MYVTDFEYANKRLSDFGYVTCYINSESGFRDVDIGCDITFNTVKNNNTSMRYATSSFYENVYTVSFDIIKNPCVNNIEEMYLSSEDVRALTTWLNRREYMKLKLITNMNNNMDIYHYGSFNIKQIMNGDRVIGLALTFTSNAPYGFGEEIYYEITTSEENMTTYIYGDSDEIGLTVYPKIKVKCLSDGDLRIINKTTNNIILVRNCKLDEEVTIDGKYKIIMSNDENHTTLSSDFSYTYFDIQIDEFSSENEYEISIPCKLEVFYSPIRKVGVI